MENKIQIINPNESINGLITPEQLSISVELKAIRKDRSAISISNGKTSIKLGSNAAPISFLGGSDVGNADGLPSLTTNYTELGTNFNYNNKDLETLGIKDIQIEFNSACAPLVVINFVDVRGKLFEMGKDSPYSVFWELPYPVFELTVKGNYGKAVTYKLHLTKFNGGFDYSSGNFEIQCNFIGYTYAFLSDVIMGHLKGISYTTRGVTKIEELKSKKNQGTHQFFTFRELNEVIKHASNSVNEIKNNDASLKAIKKADNIVDILIDFRSNVLSNLNILNTNRRINDNTIEGFYSYKPSNDEAGENQINNTYAEYNKSILDRIKELNGDGGLDSGYKLNQELYTLKKNKTIFENIYKIDFEGNLENYITNVSGNSRYIDKLTDEVKYDSFKKGVISIKKNEILDTFGFTVIDVTEGLKEIDSLIKRIRLEKTDKFIELGNEFLDSDVFNLDGKKFNPSIGNIINIICDHADIFMDCVRDVAVEAESNVNTRKEQLSNIDGVLDEIDGQIGNLKAFPTYSEMEDGVYVDKWIGNVAPNLPEVKFVEDLLEGIIKANQEDLKIQEGLQSNSLGEPQWYPVNTFDSPIFGIVNAYSKLKDDANVEDYLRLISLRGVNYFYGNSKLTDEEIKNMAILEANNVYTSIINSDIKNSLKVYATTGRQSLIKDSTEGVKFKNYASNGNFSQIPVGVVKSAILTNKKENTVIGGSFGTSSTVVSDSYLYTYSPIISGNVLNYNTTYLPLNVDKYKDYNTEFLIKNSNSIILTNNDRINLRESGVIFFSNHDNSSPFDDGSTTLKILNSRDDIVNKVNLPSYGDNVVDTEIKSVDLEQNIINGGPLGLLLQGNGDGYSDISISNYFYDKNIKFVGSNKTANIRDPRTKNKYFDNNPKAVLSSNEDSDNIFNYLISEIEPNSLRNGSVLGIDDYFVPHIGFWEENYVKKYYSLFGSDLYNSQTDIKAKAYLFLHSIPFTNLIDGKLFDSNYIEKLFKQKSGFVGVPYSWILFLGSLLSRNSFKFNVRFGDSQMSYIRDLPKNSYPTNNEFCISGNDTWFNFDNSEYKKIDEIILNLPQSAKNEIIKLFDNWIVNEFPSLIEDLEIFKSGTTKIQIRNFWRNFNNLARTNPTENFNNSILKTNFKKNYSMLLRISDGYEDNDTLTEILNDVISNDNGSPFNFLIEIRRKSNASNKLIKFLSKEKIIASASYRIWDKNLINYGFNRPITADKKDFEIYLDSFFTEYLKLSKNIDYVENTKNKAIKENIFQTINSEDIKLNLYIKVKSIYDKWICGSDEKYIDLKSNELYDSFRFIDRSYNNIEDKFKVNIIPMIGQLTENYNQSFYNYVARVLGDNNFDFFPLPSFINYNDINEMKDVFKTYSYNNMESSLKPQFVCMYSGEKSNALGDSINFKNNSFNFNDNSLPADFQTGEENIPVFLVQYGAPDQSIFKDLKLTQSEFTATDESLTITDAISKQSNTSTSVGQNLFDVYINRSYTCHVEMLGNAMIQPLMFFQLDNVPMFRGAYTIIKVTHNIKPNSMTTNFTGVRMRFNKTKMIDESILVKNMLGDIGEINTDGANLNNLSGARYSKYITYKLDSNKNNGLIKQSNTVKNYCIKEIGEFIEYVAKLWHSQSISKSYSDVIYYNDLSKIYGGDILYHESHEEGTSFDFRMMTIDKQVRSVTINDSHYDREATKKLLQLFIDSQASRKGWLNNKIIKAVYTQDNQLITHFANSGVPFKSVPNHSNHIHIEFYPPDDVVNDKITNIPTEKGLLTNVDKGSIPTNKNKENYLGLI